MTANEPSRALLYRVLGILAGVSISIGGFAVGYVLTTVRADITEIERRIAPEILPRAEERFRAVEQRLMRNESDIMDIDDDVRSLRGEVNGYLRADRD